MSPKAPVAGQGSHAALRRLRRLAAAVVRGRARLWALAAGAAASWSTVAALGAAFARRLAWSRSLALVALALLALAAALRLASSILGRGRALRRPTAARDAAAARTLGAALPHLAGWLRSAAALGHARPAHPAEAALTQAHLARVAARLRAPSLAREVRARGAPARRHARTTLLAGTLVAAGFAAASPRTAARLVGACTGRLPVERSEAPLCYDFAVTLRYPAYTGWPDWTQTGGTGDVRGLAGSTARIEARPAQPPRRAWIRAWAAPPADGATDAAATGANAPPGATAEAATDAPADVLPDGRVAAELPLASHGRYAFVLEGKDGQRALDCADHARAAVPDTPPEVSLLAPTQDLELGADGNVAVRWRANDDVGLRRAELVVEGADGAVVRKVLPLEAGRRQARGHAVLAVATLPLAPDAPATLHVEVSDGHDPPQLAHSLKRSLRLRSPRSRRQAALQALGRAADALVDWLAAEWQASEPDAPPRAEAGQAAPPTLPAAAATALGNAVADARQAVAALEAAATAEPTAAAGLREVAGQLAVHAAAAAGQPLPGPRAAQLRRRHVLERDVLVLDDLRRRGSAAQAQLGAQEVRDAGAALRQQLERAARGEAQDPGEVRRLAQAQLQRLRGRMQALLDEAAASKRAQPRAFANVEAQQQDKWQQTLERIEAALANDDDAAAAGELGHLNEMVDALAQQLAGAQEDSAGEALAAAQAQLENLAQRAQRLAGEQNVLLHQLRALTQRAQRERLAGASPTQALGEARRELAAARKELAQAGALATLPPAAAHELAALDAGLGELGLRLEPPQPQPAQALALLGQAQAQLDVARGRLEGERQHGGAQSLSPRAARGAERLLGGLDAHLARAKARLAALADDDAPPAARGPVAAALGASARRQAALGDRGAKLTQDMQALQDEIPMLGAEGGALLAQASEAMAAAQRALAQGHLGTGGRAAAAAYDRLDAFLAAAAAQAAGAKAAGVPMPMGSDAGGGSADAKPEGGEPASGPGGSGGQGQGSADGKGDQRAPGPGGARGGQGEGPGGQTPRAGGGQGPEAGGRPGPGRPEGGGEGEGHGPDARGASGTGPAHPSDGDDVDVPGPDSGSPPPALRRAVQEAGKQPPPQRYAPAVRGYYEELLR